MKRAVLICITGLFATSFAVSAGALPHFKPGIPYRSVRTKLLKLGWHGVTLPSATPCGGDERCNGFSEVYFCAGTGRATCIYMWRKGGTLIRVFGVGEGQQEFDTLAPCQSVNPTEVSGGVCR
jgi:hypothetical protein